MNRTFLLGFSILTVLTLISSCTGGEKLLFQIDRLKPAKERPAFSKNRIEGENCVGWFFPVYFGKFEPDLQAAYDNALERAPAGTQSLSDGEVFTRFFLLPPLVYIRCIAIVGTPSME
ncbi:putative lipoprotein [Leptospira inadai serovar Lyme str. 10]|uniref:Lipoprotein n=2 Tax=Leptospira inadai serovar Lyme TaxID=293084 RepID=A0ABX4YIR0_9LEPT|nr:hypothetical protein [Leptospira inadai]EQA37969.1 putative lipoprotein [Leptospira inadai serovar Lyme str. 10]PNV75160.1 hypothetical protein BES34_009710 [Leptospira inadai serovar Lyme]